MEMPHKDFQLLTGTMRIVMLCQFLFYVTAVICFVWWWSLKTYLLLNSDGKNHFINTNCSQNCMKMSILQLMHNIHLSEVSNVGLHISIVHFPVPHSVILELKHAN